MSHFIHPSLLWGLSLLALPVLIHLINLLRHRRVPWAAMEFLLASQKRNRTWVIFKQLLLLLVRLAAVAAVVLIAAQPVLRDRWRGWLGAARTHHVVLLDDSFSMSDRWQDTSGLEQAKAVVQQIALEASRQNQPQQFTVLRSSRGARGDHPPAPDLLQENVDSEFPARLRTLLNKIGPSEGATGAAAALEAYFHILDPPAAEERIVYLLTDFRAREWEEPRDLRAALGRVSEAGAHVVLVSCVDVRHPNLAITAMKPLEEIRAAGRPLSLEVAVRNFGTAPAKNVAVALEEDGRKRPGTTIAEIPPGKTVTDRFLVQFATPGQHAVAAHLESDAVAADNHRYEVVDFPAELPVLLVDGASDAADAQRLSMALSPGGSIRTGITPRIETPRFLVQNPLSAFRAIYLLNIGRLEESAVKALERYVTEGGGVAMFLGPQSDRRFFNETLYRDGAGLLPLPLAGPADLPVDRLQPAPDVELLDHPIFRLIQGQRNSDVQTVIVQRYLAAAKGWKPPQDRPVRVIARLRNGSPLAVEQRFGQGTAVAFLTTAAPVWNNWAQKGSFVAMILNLQAHLMGPGKAGAALSVGSPLRVPLETGGDRPAVRFSVPRRSPGTPTLSVDAVAGRGKGLAATLWETDRSGIYDARWAGPRGEEQVRRFAVNVDPDEGDLRITPRAALESRLNGLQYEYLEAKAFQYIAREMGGTHLAETLLYALVLLLLAEQVLAWWASYHPASRHRLTAVGGTR